MVNTRRDTDRDGAVDAYASALRHVLSRSTPEDHAEGLDWYPYAGRIARVIGAESGASVDAVGAVIAALSPRCKWAQNVEDARQYVLAAARGQVDRPRAHTFGANAAKAWRIALGEPWGDVLRGTKVHSFVANIAGDLDRVTVDTWALRAATLGAQDAVRTDAQYRAVETAYKRVAAESGVKPAEMQAIIWVTVRRLCGNAQTVDARRERLA